MGYYISMLGERLYEDGVGGVEECEARAMQVASGMDYDMCKHPSYVGVVKNAREEYIHEYQERFLQQLSATVSKLVVDSSLTVDEIASKTGLHPTIVSSVMYDAYNIPVGDLVGIALACGFDLSIVLPARLSSSCYDVRVPRSLGLLTQF